MTPAQLDIVIAGAFIWRRADGSRFATWSGKLAEWGVTLDGRSGALSADDLQTPASEVLERINRELSTTPATDAVVRAA